MTEAYIVDAIRTPVGRKKGSLSQVHPADLGAACAQGDCRAERYRSIDRRGTWSSAALTRLVRKPAISREPAGSQLDYQTRCPVRPSTVNVASSQQAVHFAAQAVMSGTSDVIVAGGVQNMNLIPISAAMLVADQFGFTDPFSTSKGWVERPTETARFRSSTLRR